MNTKIRLILTALIILNTLLLKAQIEKNNWEVDTAESFNQAHCPFTNSLTMWLLKQNLTLRVYQSSLNTEFAINDKRKFNKIAMTNIENWNDLSDEAQALTEKIYEFITKNNK